jgi:hypothetical protein
LKLPGSGRPSAVRVIVWSMPLSEVPSTSKANQASFWKPKGLEALVRVAPWVWPGCRIQASALDEQVLRLM